METPKQIAAQVRAWLMAAALVGAGALGSTRVVGQETPPTHKHSAHGGDPARQPGGKAGRPVLHRPDSRLKPDEAFRHLRKGTVRWTASRKAGLDPARALEPRRRPGGAGRYVATVFASSELPFSPHDLLGVPTYDLHLMSSPGPLVRSPEVAMTERLYERFDVSLCVILVHARCLALAPSEPNRPLTAAGEHLARILQTAHTRATTQDVPLPLAHGMLQRDALWNGSELLRKAHRRHRFDVAIGVVDDVTGNITWHAPTLTGWPIALTPPAAPGGR